MTKNRLIDLSILSGFLFIPAWYTWGTGIVLFFAFIPLLFVENYFCKLTKKSKYFFLLPFISFLVFNFATLWWIKYATLFGMWIAIFLNTFVMSFIFWLFSLTHRKLNDILGYISLVCYWLAFEYIYLHGEISFTWLNLGNGFANNIRLIQWYEYTGTLGGTLWILVTNILIFRLVKDYLRFRKFKHVKWNLIFVSAIIMMPILVSVWKFYTYDEKTNKTNNVIVLQPNIDPYKKFNVIPWETQMDILMELADSVITSETDYVIAPETFLNNRVWLDSLDTNKGIVMINEFVNKYPKCKFVFGATTLKLYKPGEKHKFTTRKLNDFTSYDSYNTALQVDTGPNIQYYHKSQLVVGVEKLPYAEHLGILKFLKVNLGGDFRGHGIQGYRQSFFNKDSSVIAAPIICYESVFGEYVTDYIKKDSSNLLFILTNDGWWGDTPGYKQHNSFARLRAIECRRSVARSANTGISCMINQRGELVSHINWWKRSAISGKLNSNDKPTFYIKHGDYIGRLSVIMSILIILYLLLVSVKSKFIKY